MMTIDRAYKTNMDTAVRVLELEDDRFAVAMIGELGGLEVELQRKEMTMEEFEGLLEVAEGFADFLKGIVAEKEGTSTFEEKGEVETC